MFVIIEDPSTREILMQRELQGDELLDCELYAKEYADSIGYELDETDGFIPACAGDFRVELLEDPENRVHLWTSQGFYLKPEA